MLCTHDADLARFARSDGVQNLRHERAEVVNSEVHHEYPAWPV